jgi:GntR family transcriptional regulator
MSEKMQPRPVRTDSRPLYLQATEAIRDLILEGEFRTGDRLPQEGEFAQQLGISRSTLRVALGYLETYGLISRRPGLGTFIATTIPPSPEDGYLSSLDRFETLLQIAERANVNVTIVSREVTEVSAGDGIATELGISPGGPVTRVEVVEAIEGRPAAYIDTYLIPRLADRNALAEYQEDAITYLAANRRFSPTHTRSEVWAKNADREVAEKLGLPERQAVLFLNETFHTRQGTCVAISKNYFVTDIFRFYLIRKLVVP